MKQAPKIQQFLVASIDKIEKKKCSQILKILEEWLKNYQQVNHADANEEKVLHDFSEPKFIYNKNISPYQNPKFCQFLFSLMEEYLIN